MNLISLLAIVASQTGSAPVAQAASITLANGVTAVEDHVGLGKVLEDGDKITIQYRVWDSTNRELADSAKRGLPFTMVIGQRNSDALVSVVLAGMNAGGVRTALIPADSLPVGIGSIVPPKTDLHLWIYVIAAKPIKDAKVESSHAERAQGALEVPRTAPRNGSTRT